VAQDNRFAEVSAASGRSRTFDWARRGHWPVAAAGRRASIQTMESSGRPGFWITLVAVYVAGTVSSLVWNVVGTAAVLGGHYTLTPSVTLTVVLWNVGGAVVASFIATLIVKAILDTDPGQTASLGTIFVGLFVGNLIANVGLLVLAGGTSLQSALLLRWCAYLVSVLIIVSSRPAPPRGESGPPSYKLPPGTSWSDESSLWTKR
jgi:hypothetical protein